MDLTLILLRWLHFLFGITWIGLLYYFNFVQTPYFGEIEPAVRTVGQQKLLPRALWWFRWGAMGTAIFGVAYLIIYWWHNLGVTLGAGDITLLTVSFVALVLWGYLGETEPAGPNGGGTSWRWVAMAVTILGFAYLIIYWAKNLGFALDPWRVAILTGGFIGLVMWGNVWFLIWPMQKVVIASANVVAGGGSALPNAAPAGRRAAIASRTNVVFSVPMLYFMGAASHYNLLGTITGAGVAKWIIVGLIVIGLVEINALTGTSGPTKKPLDSVSWTIVSGFVLWIILLAVIRSAFP